MIYRLSTYCQNLLLTAAPSKREIFPQTWQNEAVRNIGVNQNEELRGRTSHEMLENQAAINFDKE